MNTTPLTSRFFSLSTSGLLSLVLLCTCLVNGLLADDSDEKINQIKVAYLANFIRFTQWEKDKRSPQSSPWVITIIGDENFVTYLHAAFPDGKFMERPIQIQSFAGIFDNNNKADEQTLAALRSSHVVYLRENHQRTHAGILSLETKPDFLYISDIPGMAKTGGMIELCTLKNKVTFKVNTDAIRNANLHVSSKVLRLGTQVKSDR
jgi:hypothetical protein